MNALNALNVRVRALLPPIVTDRNMLPVVLVDGAKSTRDNRSAGYVVALAPCSAVIYPKGMEKDSCSCRAPSKIQMTEFLEEIKSMEVVLNVYDLPEQEAANNRLSGIGAGFYHSGVQVGKYLQVALEQCCLSMLYSQITNCSTRAKFVHTSMLPSTGLSYPLITSRGHGVFVLGAWHPPDTSSAVRLRQSSRAIGSRPLHRQSR